MSSSLSRDDDSLDALRREIDRVDDEMHDLLMRRAEVIDELIAAKRLGGERGSAFRPARETDILRRLAARHAGSLPLATIEHVWREIIGAFTQLQAPFRVHAVRAGEPAMRDLLRFHLGFATTLTEQLSPNAVIDAVRASGADLGAIPVEHGSASGWWSDLSTARDGIKVISALPFLAVGDGWPRTLVVGSAAIENPKADVFVHAALLEGEPRPSVLNGDVEILAASGGSALIASTGGQDAIGEAAETAGLKVRRLVDIGGYCAPIGQ